MRSWLVKLHRWLGLASALFLLLAGASGAIIAWDHELDAWLNPLFFHSPQTGSAVPALTLAQRLEAAQPQLQVRYLPLASVAGASLNIFVEPRINPATAQPYALSFNQVALDPVSGALLAKRQWGAAELSRENLLPFIYRLHYSLQLPPFKGIEIGIWLMGLIAIGWTLDCLASLWLAFPSRHSWRKSFLFRWRDGGYRLVFDLHRSTGVWIWLLLLMMAITSVSMNLEHQVMRPLVSLFSHLSPAPLAGRSVAGVDTRPTLPAAKLLTLATIEARKRGVQTPAGALYFARESGVTGVSFFAYGEQEVGLGASWVYLDSASGRLVAASIPGQGSAGDQFMQAMFPLHSGRLFGLAGRILISLAGLLVALLSLTGILIWLKKRRARRGPQRRGSRSAKLYKEALDHR
jgi:uncharacterized iron-regulated membrane protein